MIDDPMISIVIPVYNGANYLREAIDSALAQTYNNFEILVINDGSDDGGNTEAAALSYGDRIRYFAKENGGVATAVNLGIREMRGEYFSWLSHDDLYASDKLAVQIQALRDRGLCEAVVYSDFDYLDMDSGRVTSSQWLKQYPQQCMENSIFPVLYGLIHGCSLLIHRSHFQRIGVFDESLLTTQDYDLWFRLLYDQRSVFVPRSLVCGRLHPEQGSHTMSRRLVRESANFFLRTVRTLSAEKICSIWGHPALLFFRILWQLQSYGTADIYEKLKMEYRSMNIPETARRQMNAFHAWFNNLRGGTRKVCIFGGGIYGSQLRMMLSCFDIAVDCYSDNDPKLWGTFIWGIPCISPDQLLTLKEDMLVLAALRSPEPVIDQLRRMGCPHVAAKQTIDNVLFQKIFTFWQTANENTDM